MTFPGIAILPHKSEMPIHTPYGPHFHCYKMYAILFFLMFMNFKSVSVTSCLGEDE